MQEGYAVSDFNFIKKGPADHQRSAGISDRKMSRIVTARKVGMMTAQGVNNNIIFGNIDEDMDCLKKDVEFLLKYDDGAQIRTIRPVTPYPGTELYEIAKAKGLIKDIEDFYENKHTNSDLLTCNFTKMTDIEFYEALDWANGVLLDNYIERQREINKLSLKDLYVNHNDRFRGFRPV